MFIVILLLLMCLSVYIIQIDANLPTLQRRFWSQFVFSFAVLCGCGDESWIKHGSWLWASSDHQVSCHLLQITSENSILSAVHGISLTLFTFTGAENAKSNLQLLTWLLWSGLNIFTFSSSDNIWTFSSLLHMQKCTYMGHQSYYRKQALFDSVKDGGWMLSYCGPAADKSLFAHLCVII